MKRASQSTIGAFFKKPAVVSEVKLSTVAKPGAVFSKEEWVKSLTEEQRELLKLEIDTLDDSWLPALHKELTKPYFLNLKRFLAKEFASKTVFPPQNDIYSWSRLTKLKDVRVVILGQDPYHNFNQAHGLAFSVKPPTPPPPSLMNMFKELANCYPDFERPANNSGLLTPWSEQGVLMLNACLTVEAHKANSHANRGWEEFTEQVLRAVVKNSPKGVVFMAWGSPAGKRVDKIRPGPEHHVLRCVHPSPLSASRGWFGSAHFKKANVWLKERYGAEIKWSFAKDAAAKDAAASAATASAATAKDVSSKEAPQPEEPSEIKAREIATN